MVYGIILNLLLLGMMVGVYSTACTGPQEALWVVVGAGPAGITVVGLLLDAGVPAQEIVWIDPAFKVGRLGTYYTQVPSNTKTKFFVEFMQTCQTFNKICSPALEKLYSLDPEQEYLLSVIVDPLQDITDYLKQRVRAWQTTLTTLEHTQHRWYVGTPLGTLKAQKVVLATGCKPKTLSYTPFDPISLDTALDPAKLAHEVDPEDTIAVVGSAHSAVLVLKNLCELPVKRIINFYKKPLSYAYAPDGSVLDEANGLKGVAAEWARTVLEAAPPAHLIRVRNTKKERAAWLPQCTKIVYAIGFERETLPVIGGASISYHQYDGTTGSIAPGLFGIGIAFPETTGCPTGKSHIGINDFMEFAIRVLPSWMRKRKLIPDYSEFDDLFCITMY